MACRTTREILDQIRKFHHQLGAFYAETAEKAERNRAKALLEYMGRHEERLEARLTEYEEDAAQAILDTWFEFLPDIAKCECFEGVELNPDMSVDDVVGTALRFDDCLIQFFQEMADLSVVEDVKELFASLVRMEEEEEREVTRASVELTEGA